MSREEHNMQEFIEAMEFYFVEVGTMSDGMYQVENPNLLKERAESGDEHASTVYDAYLENIDKEPPQFTTQNAFTDYVGCLIEETFGMYIDAIRGDLAEALIGALEEDLWYEAARLLAQITGLSFNFVSTAATVAQLVTSMIKKIPGTVLIKINQKVGWRLLTKFGEKGTVNLVKLVPN